MPKFIELTNHKGLKVTINTSHIVSISDLGSKTKIRLSLPEFHCIRGSSASNAYTTYENQTIDTTENYSTVKSMLDDSNH